MLLLLALFLIVFKAVIDGLIMRKKKNIAGWIEIVYLAGITLMCYAYAHSMISEWVTHDTYIVSIIGFLLLRYGIFSFIVNKVGGKEWTYIGTAKDTDDFGRWLLNKLKISKSLFVFSKIICAFIGLTLLAGFRHGIFWWIN